MMKGSEYVRANWNSMIQPGLFPPSVLYHSSARWAVKIEISFIQGPDNDVMSFQAHPNTAIPVLAQSIIARMGLMQNQHQVRLTCVQNGEELRTIWSEPFEYTGCEATIASSLWTTPVVTLCTIGGENGNDGRA